MRTTLTSVRVRTISDDRNKQWRHVELYRLFNLKIIFTPKNLYNLEVTQFFF